MLMLTQEQLAMFNRNPREHNIFEQVFRFYYKPIYLYVRKLLNDETDADDITSKVFLELYNARTIFESSENIKAWLYWTAKNRCLDFLELQKRQKNLLKELMDQSRELENKNAQWQYDSEAIDALIAIINQLPGKYGEVARLSLLEGLTNSEIAGAMNISPNEASKLKVYATQKIRERYNNP